MWAQTSSDQQDTLLAGDERVVEEMEDELQLGNILAPAEVSNIRNEYHLRRRIRIRIAKWGTDSSTSLSLIPHFGGTKIPRIWYVTVRGADGRGLKSQHRNEIADEITILAPSEHSMPFPAFHFSSLRS